MNKRTLAILLAVMLTVGGAAVFARYGYYQIFQKTYPKTVGTRIDYCICHLDHSGGGPRNSFGVDFANNNHNLKSIENKDSDRDGFSNVDEINSLTNPGDNADYPKDRNPPEIKITEPANGAVFTDKNVTITVKGTATDDRMVSKVVVKVTGFDERSIPVRGNIWETSYEIKKNGIYDITAKAIDSSKNESLEDHVAVKVEMPDNEPPDVQFFFPAEDMVLNTLPIKVSGIASDTNEVNLVEYSLDDKKTWKNAEGTDEWFFVITAHQEGEIIAWVRATDSMGNVTPPAFQRFRLEFDSVPTPTISYPTDKLEVESDSLTVSGTFASPAVKVGVRIDGGQEQFAQTERSFWTLEIGQIAIGKHTITACAYDQLNRKSSICAEVEFTYVVHDVLPPVITITSPKEGQEFDLGDVTVTGNVKDDISGVEKVEASIDGKTWQTQNQTSFSFTFKFVEAGDYTIFLMASDKAGNFTQVPTIINITVLPPLGLEIGKPEPTALEHGELDVTITTTRKTMPQPQITFAGNTKDFTLTKIKDNTYQLLATLGAGKTKITASSSGITKELELTYKVTIEFTVGGKSMTVNGNKTEIKAAPVLINGRTFIPFRSIGDALHAKVEWDADTKTATYILGSSSYSLIVGSTNAYVNGKPIPVSTAPRIVGGSLMIPIRVFSDILGGSVNYENATRKITLVYPV